MSALFVKYCQKCNKIFPVTDEFFYKSKSRKYGLQYCCKDCNNKVSKKYREENREKVRGHRRKYYKYNKEKESERHRKYHKENREELNERSRKYDEENRKEVNERHREYMRKQRKNTEFRKITSQWKKDNKGKVNADTAKRRATKLNQTPILLQEEKYQIEMIYKKAQELGKNWHVDHIRPLAKGGLHHPDNLQIAAKKYNLEKGSKLSFRLPLNTEVYKRDSESKWSIDNEI